MTKYCKAMENPNVPAIYEAGLEYLRMIDPATSPEDRGNIKKALLDYCGHDTLVMLKIRGELLKRFQ